MPQAVLEAYEVDALEYGRGYIIPTPMDARLLDRVASAVARAAVDSGVARRPFPPHYPLTRVEDVYGG